MLRQCGVSMRSIVALGLAAGLLAAGCSATSPRRPTSPSTEPTAGAGGAATAPAREVPRPMLVWTPSRLPAGFAARVGALPGVRHAVAVVSGTVWLAQSLDGRGQVVDRPRAGMAIPLDLAGAAPQALAPLLPAADRRLLAALERGEAILGATSARLRRLGPGGMLQIGPPLRSGALGRDALARRAVRIARVVADQDIGAHELLVSRRAAATLGQTIDRYLLVEPAPGTPWQALAARIRATLPPGARLRVRGQAAARPWRLDHHRPRLGRAAHRHRTGADPGAGHLQPGGDPAAARRPSRGRPPRARQPSRPWGLCGLLCRAGDRR